MSDKTLRLFEPLSSHKGDAGVLSWLYLAWEMAMRVSLGDRPKEKPRLTLRHRMKNDFLEPPGVRTYMVIPKEGNFKVHCWR